MNKEDDALARAVKNADLANSGSHPIAQGAQIAVAYALIAICERLDKLARKLERANRYAAGISRMGVDGAELS